MTHTDLPRLDASELTNPRRVAVLAVHTSPLAQPGVGDAGGMNVYVLQSALHLARRGVEVVGADRDPSMIATARRGDMAPSCLINVRRSVPSTSRIFR